MRTFGLVVAAAQPNAAIRLWGYATAGIQCHWLVLALGKRYASQKRRAKIEQAAFRLPLLIAFKLEHAMSVFHLPWQAYYQTQLVDQVSVTRIDIAPAFQ